MTTLPMLLSLAFLVPASRCHAHCLGRWGASKSGSSW